MMNSIRNDDLAALSGWENLGSVLLSHYSSDMKSSEVGEFIGLRNFH